MNGTPALIVTISLSYPQMITAAHSATAAAQCMTLTATRLVPTTTPQRTRRRRLLTAAAGRTQAFHRRQLLITCRVITVHHMGRHRRLRLIS